MSQFVLAFVGYVFSDRIVFASLETSSSSLCSVISGCMQSFQRHLVSDSTNYNKKNSIAMRHMRLFSLYFFFLSLL